MTTNALANTYEIEFFGRGGAFREELFTGRFGDEISRDEAAVYEDRRQGDDQILVDCQQFVSERELYRCLTSEAGEHPPLILLVASAGIGKSTFLRYFFDYFIPHYREL